jgi:hypothetical protein
MKQNNLVLFFFILISGNLFAQKYYMYEKTFIGYKNYVSREFGVACTMPEKFTDLQKYMELWWIRANSHAGLSYGPILQTKDRQCVVMYSAFPFYVSQKDEEIGKKTVMINRLLNKDTITVEPNTNANSRIARGQITFELKTAIGGFDYLGNPLNDTTSFDFNNYVTVIAGEKARAMFNADSIFFYNIPLEKAYLEKYSYCTGMIFSKHGRATMSFKWFFTPRGKKKEEKYINMLSKQVWYEDNFKNDEE